MILVVDASFAAKVVLNEPGTSVAQGWWLDDAVTWVSPAIVAAEVEAAIHVHHRLRPVEFDVERRRAASATWQQVLTGIAIHDVDAEAGDRAVTAIDQYGPLRGADACYVALAVDLADATSTEAVVLATFDQQQRAAGTRAGLVLAPARTV